MTAEDGQPIIGTLARPNGPPAGGIVLVPMYKSSRGAFAGLQTRLALAGYLALAIDPRGHGDSVNDKDGKPVSIERGTASVPEPNPFLKMWMDVDAGMKLLVERGAPAGKIGVVGASVGASVAIHLATRSKDRPRALVLMTPGVDYLGVPSLEHAKAMPPRPVLILTSEEESGKGPKQLKQVLAYDDAELRVVPGTDIHGTFMLGRVTSIEASIVTWLDTALSTPPALEVGEGKTVIIDGDLSDGEASNPAVAKIPIPNSSDATVRISHTTKRLDVAFDIPERYIRLNEVVVFIDGSGKAARTPDQHCYRISFCPKNPQRAPIIVQRGGLKGWEDTDDKGITAFAKTEDKKHWTAEIGLDLSRFLPGELPRKGRIAFQANGARTTDVRSFPGDANLATTPKTWAPMTLK